MSLDRILAFLGIAATAVGVGIAILVPNNRIVGWICLSVGVLVLLGIPGWHAVAKRTARKVEPTTVLDYLRTACVFMDGLPLFLSYTWQWGPSVPNYSAGRAFPDQSVSVSSLKSVKAVINEALAVYTKHSQQQGMAFPSQLEMRARVLEIKERFWESVEACATQEWPRRSSEILRELHALTIPDSERNRILNLRADRS